MVKLLLAEFRQTTSKKEKTCSNCKMRIERGVLHFKHDGKQFVRLHFICYSNLALQGINDLSDKLIHINRGNKSN